MGKQVKSLPVVWDRKAYQDFEWKLNDIKSDSPINARRVKTRVNNIVKSLPNFPLKYRSDELKDPNDDSFRVFNQDGFRVSYRVTKVNIQIVRVRHGSQEPISF